MATWWAGEQLVIARLAPVVQTEKLTFGIRRSASGALAGERIMDHTPGQGDADAGAHTYHQKGEPVGDQLQVQVDATQQQDQSHHQPGQAIQSRSAAAGAGASKSAEAA